MSDRRPYLALLRESLLALAVLALVFLNFGHTTASAGIPVGGDTAQIADSWCGDPLLPGSADHAPCHACRFDGAALPPPPMGVEPVIFCAKSVVFDAAALSGAPVEPLRLAQPRGPPATL